MLDNITELSNKSTNIKLKNNMVSDILIKEKIKNHMAVKLMEQKN